jgi:hypothetical protein
MVQIGSLCRIIYAFAPKIIVVNKNRWNFGNYVLEVKHKLFWTFFFCKGENFLQKM